MAVTAPPTRHPPETFAPRALVEPERRSITLEHVLYAALAALAIFTRLYLLGDRALHHDETLHAAYPWRIYQGQGYQHDPLLHGPFLFYITAFTYLLFGDSDFTARLSAAVFGIVLTLLPWLLRRDLGRGPALIAGVYLLLSPVTLYVSRFLRQDVYTVVFELLSVIAILRYSATERAVWLYTLAAAMALMLTTLETFYLFLLIIGSFVSVWVLWQVARRALWLLAAYVAVAVVALKGLPLIFGPFPLPTPDQALQVRNRPDNNLIAYFRDVAGVVGPMISHPAGIVILLSTILLIGALLWIVFVRRGADGRTAWRQAADTVPQGSIVGALDRITRRQWLIAFTIAFVIYAVLYTALLSNPRTPNIAGLVTGISGSLLYWLGQQGVRRGNQPPQYYLFQLWVYEPLLLMFGPAGLLLVARRLFTAWRAPRTAAPAQRSPKVYAVPNALFAPALLAWWSIGALAVYTWAGEKMPWLTLHIVLPLTLLSAWALAQLWNWARRGGFDALAISLTATTGALLLLLFNRFTVTILDPQAVRFAAVWPLLGIGFIGLLCAGLVLLYRSGRPALLAVLALVLSFGLVFTIRSSIRLSYVNGDVPVEPQVFVQTSPDVPRVMEQLRQASVLRTGKLDLPIRFDNETIWDWYLRNYTNTDGSRGARIDTITDDVQAVFMLNENIPANEANLDGFVRQQYPLRWWFPECEVYRIPSRDAYCGNPQGTSVVSRLLSQPWNGQALADAWQFWFNRKLPAPLGSTDWTLFVRPGLAAEFGISGAQPK